MTVRYKVAPVRGCCHDLDDGSPFSRAIIAIFGRSRWKSTEAASFRPVVGLGGAT